LVNGNDDFEIYVFEMLGATACTMVRAGVEPAKIYATIKTGLMPTTDNVHVMKPADLREWQRAAEEYDVLQAQLERAVKNAPVLNEGAKPS